MRNSLVFIAAILFMAFECTKEDSEVMLPQDIVFARIYANYAWGESFDGWLIDRMGNVKGFSLNRNPQLDWQDFTESGLNSREEVLHNLRQTDTIYSVVDPVELTRYYDLIRPASKGILKEKETGAADMGQFSYYAIQYMPRENLYRWVLLHSEGDNPLINLSPEAGQIYNWLQEIDRLAIENLQIANAIQEK